MKGSKIIRVNVFASSNLEDVRNVVFDLLMQLNRTFRNRGIEFALSTSSYDSKDEEIDIALYWQDFGDLPKEKFESAYESLKAGGNPSKIYVFFRESKDACEDAMQAFKDSFATKYGHFYCHFEHIDSVRFELAVRCLEYLPDQLSLNTKDNWLSIKENGDIQFFGESIASIENLPFAKLNQKRQSLCRKIADAEKEIEHLETKLYDSPDDEDLKEILRDERVNRANLKEEIKKYDELLFSRAIFFIKESGREMDERVVRARELFEKGRMADANKVLDIQEIKQKDINDAKLFEETKQVRIKNIQAFTAKAEIVMLDDTLSMNDRFNQACIAYEEAIRVAKEISYRDYDLSNIIFDYGNLLANFERFSEAKQVFKEALEIRLLLAKKNPKMYEFEVAMTLNNLGTCCDDKSCGEAEQYYNEALEICRRLAEKDPKAHESDLATILNNLGAVHYSLARYIEAQQEVTESLKIRRRLAEANREMYEIHLVDSLNVLGVVHEALNKYDAVEREWPGSLEIFREQANNQLQVYDILVDTIFFNLKHSGKIIRCDKAERDYAEALKIIRRLAKKNPEAYEGKLAWTLYTLGTFYYNLNRYKKSEREYAKALEITRRLALKNPEVYEKRVAETLNMLFTLHSFCLTKNDAAEQECKEILDIYRRLNKKNPEVYEKTLAGTLANTGILYINLNKFHEAERIYTEALDIYRRLKEITPNVYEYCVANALYNLSICHVNLKSYGEAEQELMEALEIYHRYAEKYQSESDIDKIKDIENDLAVLREKMNKQRIDI